MNGFPTRAPAELEERARQQQWLIDTLWSEQGVGIVGGEPKCGKSFLALDLAVAVAAGVPCLGHFAAARGPVLLFCAEDAGHIVRHRLEGICHAAGAAFETLDIAVIDVPVLRLDHGQDRSRLLETVERISPRLLVLDPLVRLHAIDENAAADVVPILGFLRDIQRRFETAVMLVHHARKSGGSRPGQALRGSSDLHAWGNAAPVVMPNGERRTAPALAFSAVWLGITSGDHVPPRSSIKLSLTPRKVPGLMDGGVLLSRMSSFSAGLARTYISVVLRSA